MSALLCKEYQISDDRLSKIRKLNPTQTKLFKRVKAYDKIVSRDPHTKEIVSLSDTIELRFIASSSPKDKKILKNQVVYSIKIDHTDSNIAMLKKFETLFRKYIKSTHLKMAIDINAYYDDDNCAYYGIVFTVLDQYDKTTNWKYHISFCNDQSSNFFNKFNLPMCGFIQPVPAILNVYKDMCLNLSPFYPNNLRLEILKRYNKTLHMYFFLAFGQKLTNRLSYRMQKFDRDIMLHYVKAFNRFIIINQGEKESFSYYLANRLVKDRECLDMISDFCNTDSQLIGFLTTTMPFSVIVSNKTPATFEKLLNQKYKTEPSLNPWPYPLRYYFIYTLQALRFWNISIRLKEVDVEKANKFLHKEIKKIISYVEYSSKSRKTSWIKDHINTTKKSPVILHDLTEWIKEVGKVNDEESCKTLIEKGLQLATHFNMWDGTKWIVE